MYVGVYTQIQIIYIRKKSEFQMGGGRSWSSILIINIITSTFVLSSNVSKAGKLLLGN